MGIGASDPLRILDLGVGSGALLCALLSEFANARGVGVDISAGAANVAPRQYRGLRPRVAGGDSGRATGRRGLEGRFDLIVSNPPYVPSADIAELPREVRDFDPRLALDGGVDGLDAYRRIIPESRSLLSGGGWLLVEIGAGQAADVLAIVEQFGFGDVMIDRDLAGHDRVVAARRP